MAGQDPQNDNNGQGPNNNKRNWLYALAGAGLLLYAFNMAGDPAQNDNDPVNAGQDPVEMTDPSAAAQGQTLPDQPAESTTAMGQMPPAPTEIGYSQFKEHLNNDEVEQVTFQNQGNDRLIEIELKNGTTHYTIAVEDSNLINQLEEKGVEYSQLQEPPPPQPSLLMTLAPTLLLIGFFIFMMRKKMGAGGPGGVGKSKGKISMEGDIKVGFDDVAGIDHVKEDLQEMVGFLKDPAQYQRLGARMPTGGLLVGPPGTGKTLMAKAIAGEAGVPFISTSGSEFVEMFVGVGASRVRDIFEKAKKNAPCIIFIDEIDAVGRQRGAGMGGGNDEREQTLNQLLVEMDGFEENPGIIVLAATNRPDVLDPALQRPGRFDRQIVVSNPDLTGRDKILQVHLRKVPLAENVSSLKIARGTPGFSGADLANLVNEAALLATRRSKELVDMHDFESAKDKIMMGAERPTLMSDEEKKLTAYHEAGHAIVGYFEEHHDPLHKATIVPRGQALGMVVSLPERDKLSMSENQYLARLSMAFGGRMAEELTFGAGNVTSGAASDIQQATKIARAMVTQFGFSDRLGRVQYEGNEQEVFLGRSVQQHKNVSDATAEQIDEEIRNIIKKSEDRAREVLTEHHDAFVRLAETLLEYETLTGDEITRVIEGEAVGRSPGEPPGIADGPAENGPEPETPVAAPEQDNEQEETRPPQQRPGPFGGPGPG